MLYNTLYNSIDKVIFISNYAKEVFLSSHPKIDPDKLEVIHESTVLNAPQVEDLRKTFNITSEKDVILSHGVLNEDSGVDVLLKAVSQIEKNKYHLFLIGNGEEKFLRDLNNIVVANQLEDNITFLGDVASPQSYIAQCDFGILPTINDSVSMIPSLDYMIMGKPQICSNNGAQMEYIENKRDGYSITPDDPYTLAASISCLIDNSPYLMHVGERAKKKFNNQFAYSQFYANVLDIYQKL